MLLPSFLILLQLNSYGATNLKRQWSHEFDDSPSQKAPPPEFLREPTWSDFFANLENATKVSFRLAWDSMVPYRSYEREAVSPASTLKLLTAATALHVLGPDFQYANSFQGLLDANTKILINPEFTLSGDPTWAHPAFGESLTTRILKIIEELKSKEIKSIRGLIRFNVTSNKVKNLIRPARWKSSWLDQCYAGLPTPATLNGNCADLQITSKTTYKWLTQGVNIPVTVKMAYGFDTQNVVIPDVEVKTDPVSGRVIEYVVSGSYAFSQRVISLPTHESEAWLRNLFLMELKKAGITYSLTNAPLSVRRSKNRAPVFVDLSSKPLKEMMGPFLQDSINIFGDRLILEVAERLGAATIADPEMNLLSQLVNDSELISQTEIYDGSGLIAANKVSPELMLKLLTSLMSQPNFDLLLNSMPVAGVSGTLINRLNGPLTKGKIIAKSGTIDGVSCLSGYFKKAENDLKPFVIITLSDLSASTVLRPMQDKIVTQFVDYNR